MSLISFLIWMRASQNLDIDCQETVDMGYRNSAEPVQLLFVLRLCGFNHQSSSNRPAHCGRMEPKVHQPLGDVHGLHSARLLEVPNIDDELVSNLDCIVRPGQV